MGRRGEGIGGQGGGGEGAGEGEIHEIVEFVALAPPEEALGIVDHTGARAELAEAEEIVDVGSGEKNGVGEIDDGRRRGVVVENHIAAEERGACSDVEETGAAGSGEAENARDDVRWTGGNVGNYGAFAAARGPTAGRAGLGEIALARFENHADLMHTGGDAACGGRRASAGSGEAARRCGESEMRRVRHAGDGKCAVVSGDANARGGDELAEDEAVGYGGLNRPRGGRSGASARCPASGWAGGGGGLAAGRYRDHRKRAVVTTDPDARDGHGLSRGKTVRCAGGDGDEKTVLASAVGAGGDPTRGGVRRAAWPAAGVAGSVFVRRRLAPPAP